VLDFNEGNIVNDIISFSTMSNILENLNIANSCSSLRRPRPKLGCRAKGRERVILI
jgi:hypothetical protein